jgi:tetratricopeptide (TPR) repeat protein
MHSARSRSALAALLFSAAVFGQTDPGDFIKQGQALSRLGKQDEATAMYRNALQFAPNSYAANSGAGVALDLKGDGAEAQQYFAKAIDTAPSPSDKIRALRDMALSYGFEGNCKGAVPYDRQAYDLELAAKDFYNAGEVADELARICIDTGDLETAATWYRTGYDAGLKEPDIKPDRKDLWEFRWEHAQARLAARRGDKAEAQKHAAAAGVILAKGDNPQQEAFLPYLLGYVAFYGGDYKTALEQFQKASQDDAFIAAMIAQTYEKLGDRNDAMNWYRKALGFNTHNPPVAYARPLARKKLGE